MATISAVRTALASTLSTAIVDTQVYGTAPGTVVTPAIVINPASGSYHETMGRGSVEFRFALYVVVGLEPLDLAQERMDGYLASSGSSSIVAAIEATPDLGLSYCDAIATGFDDWGPSEQGDQLVLSAVVNVTVVTRGTS